MPQSFTGSGSLTRFAKSNLSSYRIELPIQKRRPAYTPLLSPLPTGRGRHRTQPQRLRACPFPLTPLITRHLPPGESGVKMGGGVGGILPTSPRGFRLTAHPTRGGAGRGPGAAGPPCGSCLPNGERPLSPRYLKSGSGQSEEARGTSSRSSSAAHSLLPCLSRAPATTAPGASRSLARSTFFRSLLPRRQ